MRRFIALTILCITLASNAQAGTISQKKIDAQLATLANEKLGKDFRVVFKMKKNAHICGGEGDAYIGQVEMNKYQRGYTEQGQSDIKDHWVKLDKHYTIFTQELNQPNPQLFDSDQCME